MKRAALSGDKHFSGRDVIDARMSFGAKSKKTSEADEQHVSYAELAGDDELLYGDRDLRG